MSQPELELPGAPSALKFIADRELQLRAILKESEAKLAELCLMRDAPTPPSHLDGADFDVLIARAKAERKEAEDSYYKAQKALLDYDKNVDTGRRDVSISITKSDAVKFASSFAIVMRGGVEQAAIRHAQEGIECQTREEMHMLVAPVLRKCLASAIKSAVMEAQMPDWFGAAISDAL